MSQKNPFAIEFSAMPLGKHDFEFDINNDFFESLEFSPLEKGTLHASVIFDKTQQQLFHVSLQIEGFVAVPCDRCNQEIEIPLEIDETLVVKLTEHEDECDLDEHIWVIMSSEHQLDLGHLFYELILTHLPIKKVHANKKDCGVDIITDLEHEQQKSEKKSDDRWNKLLDLLK